jgi:lipoprotein NlpD
MIKSIKFLVLLSAMLLSGCFGLIGEEVRAPVYEGGQLVARSGPAPSSKAYVVKPGDTLYSIAWRENTDFRALAVWNKLPSNYAIHPGQRLMLEPPVQQDGVASVSTGSPTALAELQSPGQSERPARPAVQPASTPDNSKQELMRKAQALHTRNGQADKRAKGPWKTPTRGRMVQTYVSGDLTRKGVHIAGREGQSIHAARNGKVVYSGSGLVGYGNLIIVKHDKNYLSAYGYNRKILVKEGQMVTAGQRIAEMGRSEKGKSLLHFEIRYKGKPINPASVMSL